MKFARIIMNSFVSSNIWKCVIYKWRNDIIHTYTDNSIFSLVCMEYLCQRKLIHIHTYAAGNRHEKLNIKGKSGNRFCGVHKFETIYEGNWCYLYVNWK